MRFLISGRWPRLAIVTLFAAACSVATVQISPIPIRPPSPVTVRSPVKAHLADGATIVYSHGLSVTGDSLIGSGWLFSVTLRDSLPVTSYPLAEVVAMESYSTDNNEVSTLITSVVGGVALALIAVGAAFAIFGSCPTVYADAGAGLALQAESFSQSIAPLFESRDTDRLAVRTDAHGRFVIEIRNEALETHYINYLQVVEVRHGAGETVLPDGLGRPLAVAGFVPVVSVRDRLGTDQRGAVSREDRRAFRSQRTVVDAAVAGELYDHLDVTLPRPGADTVAVVFRMRNSLLNTVMLYDVLLAGRGAAGLDWVGSDLGRIADAATLGNWFATRMGMRVFVEESGTWRQVGRIADVGPIAWKDVAVLVPVPAGEDSLRVRLAFVADAWRVDQIRVATRVRRPEVRLLAPEAVLGREGQPDSAALAAVRAADGRYLQTVPGDRFTVRWDAGPVPPDTARAFLLAAQGYYIEWMRQAWLRRAPETPEGAPTEALLRRTLAAWRVQQADFERRFERTKLPVR